MKQTLRKRVVVFLFTATYATTACCQCRYCESYENFTADQWTEIDTIYVKHHSKSRQFWIGGNDYGLSTGEKATDKYLKKNAFVVMQGDTLYVNCQNLRFEGTRFGNGFVRAIRIGNRSLLIVNRLIGKKAMNRAQVGMMFGAIGTAISVNDNLKQQVCYVISKGANDKGVIDIRLIDDHLMELMLEGHDDLKLEYLSEQDDSKRQLATRVVPLLERAGIIKSPKILGSGF